MHSTWKRLATSDNPKIFRCVQRKQDLSEKEMNSNVIPNNQSIHERLIETFPEHTNEQPDAIIAKAEETYENDWCRRSLAERQSIIKKA